MMDSAKKNAIFVFRRGGRFQNVFDSRNELFTGNPITFIFEKSKIDKKFVSQSMIESCAFNVPKKVVFFQNRNFCTGNPIVNLRGFGDYRKI